MSNKLTLREQEYCDCQTPLLTGGQAAGRIIIGVFASLAQAVFMPSSAYSKADRGLIRTAKEITYSKYKKAVLRKQAETPKKNDRKLLEKLNSKPFVLAEDSYDPDEFTGKIYEEYMKNNEERRNRK